MLPECNAIMQLRVTKYILKNLKFFQINFMNKTETDACMRQCCGNQRGFQIHILDNIQQEVMTVTREFKCCAGCCW